MKKKKGLPIWIFLCILILISIGIYRITVESGVFASDEIKIKVNGEKLKTEHKPYFVDENLMIPVKAIGEALGARIENKDEKTVILKKGWKTVTLHLDSNIVYINDDELVMNGPPVLKDGEIYISTRYASEILCSEVGYFEEKKTVIVEST